ncbi:hypothetical protein [Actinomadura sp. 7K534]|uniref:hypothetical protein n=1 Tax=Actinomadura sp. 7K534 TaxID=2530366 RepID=UPI001043B953|nr:hypothetical protein [Actinomadura sp. 7K534]TDB86251.1 hypothetical protein E1266_34480 [Actinomadura sp. 7K534]
MSVLLLMGVVWPTVTACAPESGGVAGMTLDRAGRPTVVVAWCLGKAPDSIYLSTRDDLSPEVNIRLQAPAKFPGKMIEVPITSPPVGWTADPPSPVLDAGRVYSVYAPVTGSEYTSRGPRFTLGRLRGDGWILVNEYDQEVDLYVDLYIRAADLVRRANC